MCPLSYYQIMRNCKDKRTHRYQMVQYALSNGVKPAARVFGTSPPLVRKWLTRFKEQGYVGLLDLSRRPHHSPLSTAQSIKDHIVALRKRYHRLGAEQVKTLENLKQAPKTIRKFWRDAGVQRGRRKKKYIVKQNLREVKKQFYLFQQCCEDTKDLFDIPEYWPQMKRLDLPVVQYTRREISCGILFTGFANERSLIHATLFAAYINCQMAKYKALPEIVRHTARPTTEANSAAPGMPKSLPLIPRQSNPCRDSSIPPYSPERTGCRQTLRQSTASWKQSSMN